MAEAVLSVASNYDSKVLGIDQMEDQSSIFSWPMIDFQVPPCRTHHFFNQFRVDSSKPNNFHKAVKWSPDGSCFLTCSDDNAIRVFTLQYNESGDDRGYYDTSNDSYGANRVISEGEIIYDYCWYPYMFTSSPETCVFATTAHDLPVHLWDANSGKLHCTYRAYDAMDEITAAFLVTFNPTGTKIFDGYNKSLRIFDVHHPGREFKHVSTLQANKEGQSGIISSITFSTNDSGMLATGSYDQTTALYREDNMELLYVLHGQEGGVTHVEFSKDGNYLYTGGRNDPFILCWDIRKSVEIVYKFYRSTETTNQRIYFDIDPIGQNLATGGEDGLVHMYNLQSGQWVSSFKAALDTVNGFSFHPFYPMAATSSGHRRYVDVDDSGDDVILNDDENCVSVWSFPSHFYPNSDDISSANFKEPAQMNFK